jgi:hypothetical protein
MRFCIQNTEHKQEITYKNFLQEVASSQISEFQNLNVLSLDELHLPGKQPTSRGLTRQTGWGFSKHKLDEIVSGGGSSSIIPDSVKWTLHMRKVKQDMCVNFALFHFT